MSNPRALQRGRCIPTYPSGITQVCLGAHDYYAVVFSKLLDI